MVVALISGACAASGPATGTTAALADPTGSSAASGADPALVADSPLDARSDDADIAGSTRPTVPSARTEGAPSPAVRANEESVEPFGTPLPSAQGLPAETAAWPTPVAVTFADVDVVDATVEAVGVEPDGSMEVPGAESVGWYQFGPTPGEPGSAVLAAHIAFDGVDGVFRNLADAEVGAVVEVAFDDGSRRRFEVIDVDQHAKVDLPSDQVFARTGDPVLTLITCGGDFLRSQRSYRDNVVVTARPLAS